MFSRVAIVLFVVAVAEFMMFDRASGKIGAGNVVFIVVASMVAGVVILRRQFARWLAELTRNQDLAGLVDVPRHARRAVGVLGALLMIVPGFITSVLGLLLLAGPVQRLVAPLLPPVRFFQSVVDPMTARHQRRDVVDVDVVTSDKGPASPPEDGDRPCPPGLDQAQP